MKRLMICTVGGFGLALACGLSRLPHLSATVFTLTVFCSAQALVIVALDALSRRWADALDRGAE